MSAVTRIGARRDERRRDDDVRVLHVLADKLLLLLVGFF